MVLVVQTLVMVRVGALSVGVEPMLEAGGAIGDSGLGKSGGGDLATGGDERWLVRDSLVYGLPPEAPFSKFRCV